MRRSLFITLLIVFNIILYTIPQNAVTISGVGNAGNLEATSGPPSSVGGLDTDFIGATNNFGISDYPDARDNSIWVVSVSYVGVLPGCGSRSLDFIVPPHGQQIFAICYIH